MAVGVEDFLPDEPVDDGPQQGLDTAASASSTLRNSSLTLRKSSRSTRSILQKSSMKSTRLSLATERLRSVLATSGLSRSERLHLAPTNEIFKPKVLALHGKKSNNAVTKLQLENLGITEEKYDIFYLNAMIEEAKGGPHVEELFNGPFFSWYHDKTDGRFKQSFLSAVAHVQKEIQHFGGVDIIYGFSQGATIAAAIAAVCSDSTFRKIILETEQDANMKRSVTHIQHMKSIIGRISLTNFKSESRPARVTLDKA